METILSTLELIGARTGNCQRIAIALAETQLPFCVRQIDLERGDQRSARHLARVLRCLPAWH